MNNKASNKNKSLCEKSMKMVTNIIKLSSFSIAKMSLGSTDPAYSTKNLASMTGSVIAASQPLLPQFPESRRSQEPESGARPRTYLIESVEGIGSSHVIHEERDVDEKAAVFIRNFHKKRSDSYGTSMLSPHMLPPPHIIN